DHPPEIALPTVGWGLLVQLAIKTMSHRYAHRPVRQSNSSVEITSSQLDYNSDGHAQFHLKLLSPADPGERNILEFCTMSTTFQAIYFLHMSVCLHVWLCTVCHVWSPRRPEEDIRSDGIRATGLSPQKCPEVGAKQSLSKYYEINEYVGKFTKGRDREVITGIQTCDLDAELKTQHWPRKPCSSDFQQKKLTTGGPHLPRGSPLRLNPQTQCAGSGTQVLIQARHPAALDLQDQPFHMLQQIIERMDVEIQIPEILHVEYFLI
ncbi:hypothetical protein STEG23_014250, partial [Scotinomys teguina]